MVKSGTIRLLLTATAFLASFLFACDLQKDTSQTPSSSIEQSESSEESPCAHVFGEWITWDEPNCEFDGLKTRVCSLCNEEESCVLDALGHIEGERITVDPTCLNGGFDAQYCSRCGETLDYETFPKLTTHKPTVTSLDRKPTCTVAGYVQKHCACHEVVTNTFSPSLGGHVDDNDDLLCDTCEEKLYSIPVQLQLQGNATASTANHVFIGEESGGIVSVAMGENSIFYQHYTFYPSLSDDPDYLNGNVVYSRPQAVAQWELDSLTATYHHHITAENPTFGKPQKITLEIADTTQTGLVVLEQSSIPSEEEPSNFTQVLLFWGTLSSEITVTGTNNEYLTVRYYTDIDDNVLSNEKTITVVLTQPVTHLRVYYQKIDNAT